MPYTIFITPTATEDIAEGVEHYNAIATDPCQHSSCLQSLSGAVILIPETVICEWQICLPLFDQLDRVLPIQE